MPARTYYTYIMSSRTKVLYIGITNNLERRVQQHKEGKHDSFTKEYRCHHLVWFERYATAASAIAREKQLKGWRRARKIALIEEQNLEWQDLSKDWGKSFGANQPPPAVTTTDVLHLCHRETQHLCSLTDVILSGAQSAQSKDPYEHTSSLP
jgi:putative endonuclease